MTDGLLSYADAAALVAGEARRLLQTRPESQRIPLGNAQGRVLAQSIVADMDQPPFARSTRDGFAGRSAEINLHTPLHIAGSTHAGDSPAGPLPTGSVWEIMTGAPVPEGADSVAMLEHTERNGQNVQLRPPRALQPGENLVPRGAQARSGEHLIQTGETLGPAHIALAAACGYKELSVFVRPRVAILTTGDELVPVAATPGPGQIRNSNAPMLAALVEAAGGQPWVLPAAKDSASALDSAFAIALQADMLLISGGVSAGKFDLVEPSLARRGAKFHFTGVRMQPGKPLVFGEAPRTTPEGQGPLSPVPFFGLPGNPISSAVTFLLFGARVLKALAGAPSQEPRFVLARLTNDVKGKAGLTRFLPAIWHGDPGLQAEPQVAHVPWHGSGDLAAFARANGFLVVPEEIDNLAAGTLVRVLLF
jgi:molybdopterin molybdotransferase